LLSEEPFEAGAVRLRPMTPDDIGLFLEWVNDPEASGFWYGSTRRITADELLRDWEPFYFDGSAPRRGRGFIIEADGRPLGMISYTDSSDDIDDRRVRADVDIIIGRDADRDRGYGSDAVRAMAGFLFDRLGYHRIDITTYEINLRMQKVLERLGFREEGRSREGAFVDGRYLDEIHYGLLAREFNKHRRS
jgi:RimJ/RimL family protein N-acetyltransferase